MTGSQILYKLKPSTVPHHQLPCVLKDPNFRILMWHPQKLEKLCTLNPVSACVTESCMSGPTLEFNRLLINRCVASWLIEFQEGRSDLLLKDPTFSTSQPLFSDLVAPSVHGYFFK